MKMKPSIKQLPSEKWYDLREIQFIGSSVVTVLNIHGTEETEMPRDKRDHVNKISN